MEKEALLSINRPQKVCMNCNEPINTIERHPSALVMKDRTAPERFDYCPECWDHIKRETFESFWMTRRKTEDKPRKLTRRERAVALRALFESLWDRRSDEDEEVGPHLYFLAHLLMKWGGLKYREARIDEESGREMIVFENPTTKEAVEVESFELSDEMVLRLKEEFERFLAQYAPEGDVEL